METVSALDLNASPSVVTAVETDDARPAKRKRTPRTPTVEYDLRLSSLLNRVQTERRCEAPRTLKPKCKPAPLSKYRRRTANGRERIRMNEMNGAFDALRQAVPEHFEATQKQTKIVTLRLAMSYIRSLRDLLGCESASGGGESPERGASTGANSSASEGQSSPGYSGLDSEGESLQT